MDNPYSAPDAYVQDRADEPPKRPVLVWVIFIFAMFGVFGGVIGVVMQMTGHMPMVNNAERAYIQSLTPFDHALSLIALLLSGFGALELFRLKKRAATVLAAYGLFKVATTAYIYMKPTYRAFLASMGSSNIFRHVGMYVGWAIIAAIIAYAFKLRRDGVLR